MARLTDVFRGGDAAYKSLKSRRIPISCEDNITMTMEMDSGYLTCDDSFLPSKTELEAFMKKYRLLSKEEVEDALQVVSSEFVAILNQMVPCVGCRRSAETLYQQVTDYGYSAFHPLVVDANGTLTLPKDKLTSKFLCTLFHCPSTKMTTLLESLSKCKSGRRCLLHSLESQRVRTVSSWVDVWDYMDEKCQEHVVLVDTKTLYETLDRYLRKHRFCSECRTKVLRAYSILVGEVDHTTEPGYIPNLYDGIECCKEDHHLHVLCKTEFVSRLIAKAVPELVGSRRERHAKTMEIAQEEVLTCLGLTVFERLHRIQQKFREEERTWEIIMCIATQALRRSFEMAVEKKLGVSQLELLCEEISKEEQVKQQKKELKKQKRKRKKEKKAEEILQEEEPEFAESVEADEAPDEVVGVEADSNCPCTPKTNGKKKKKRAGKGKSKSKDSLMLCVGMGDGEKVLPDPAPLCQSSRCSSETSRDCGYSSECNNDHATCSSPEISEIACSENFCTHNFDECHSGKAGEDKVKNSNSLENVDGSRLPIPYRSLEEQLESSCSSDDDNDCIPQEELSAIYDPLWGKRRELLREEIRSRFNDLVLRSSQTNHNESDSAHTQICLGCLEDADKMCQGAPKEPLEESPGDEKGGKENMKKPQRQTGTSKTRQGQGNKRYKGKNRRILGAEFQNFRFITDLYLYEPS
ncbi:unnamed protein product [Allacma fusca]|uniref:Gametogenetin-binding protein 2 n=1 Tax=Allacma fusca TaxID=39272 RepID=A0A8J2KSE9_9HEXA|nr:unnamed protein product [Allacma fusca]